MGDPYKGKLPGHALKWAGRCSSEFYYRKNQPERAICECGAESPDLPNTVEARKAWHRQHKADMIDTFVHNGMDDRGNEVYL
jgi:hypothetical protein